MNKGIYRIAAGVGAAVILVSSATAQAATVTANGTPAPVASDSIAGWPAAPAVTSETAVLIDADTGAVLYDKGMDEYRYPASTTKIMTMLVAIENSSPKDIVTFTETGIRDVTWDSSNINAQLGETMTMKDCWMAAYIKSANEVCAQIAETVGGTEANFVEMMNQKAKELGCTHTHFANASGLPDENHYSSAHDLAKIMRACLRNKRFRQVMKMDPHTRADGTYSIRSIYFDNIQDKALREKVNGVAKREKFRIRYYNDNFERITLEKKIKNNNLCIKVSAGLSEKECRKLLNGDLEWMKTHSSSLVQELYGKMKYQQLRPRVLVSYTREPYIYTAGNVRITFDWNVRTTMYHGKFLEKKVYDVETGQQCPGEMIMEVKYDAFLPGVIQNLIQTDGVRQESFSKYAACRTYG